eukprot:1178835-Prorocentrum_minimum.AAC.2
MVDYRPHNNAYQRSVFRKLHNFLKYSTNIPCQQSTKSISDCRLRGLTLPHIPIPLTSQKKGSTGVDSTRHRHALPGLMAVSSPTPEPRGAHQ